MTHTARKNLRLTIYCTNPGLIEIKEVTTSRNALGVNPSVLTAALWTPALNRQVKLSCSPAYLCDASHAVQSVCGCCGMWLGRGDFRGERPPRAPRDISTSGLIGEGLLVPTWPVCVSVQGCADVSRQMLRLHSRNTICERRLKHSTASLRCIFILANMYNRRMIFVRLSLRPWLSCTCVNVSVWVTGTEIDSMHVCVCPCSHLHERYPGSLPSLCVAWVSAVIELWVANSLLQQWDYVLF